MALLDSLEMGKKALAASQLAMDVTGQNISNANTEGYSRKRVVVTSDQRKDDAFGQMGNGVDIKNVQRMRNEFIDEQVTDGVTDQGFYQEIDDALERVENIFNEPTDTSLNATMDKFWNAWHDLSNNPADFSAREAVASSTQVLTSQFHAVGGELYNFKATINDKIETTVSQINNLTKEIKRLNDEIATAENTEGGNANDSRDRRQIALRQLAELVPIDYNEDRQGRVSVTTQGVVVVGPQDTIELEMYRQTNVENDGSEVPLNFARFAASNLNFMPKSGGLAALYDIRDNQIKKYQDKLDAIASGLVSKVNEAHTQGYDLDGDTGIYFFDPTKTTATTIELGADILRDSKNIAAASGGRLTAVSLAGQTPVGVPLTINLTNIDPKYRYVAQGSISVSIPGVPPTVLQEGPGKDYTVDYKTGRIFMANATAVDITFKYNDSPFGGTGDGSKALAIAKLKDVPVLQQDAEGNPTQSLQEFYSGFIGTLGIDRNEASSNLETRKFIVEQLDKRQQEIAGVSLDEEMANMIKFEHTYQAGARYISTINSMMESIINLAG